MLHNVARMESPPQTPLPDDALVGAVLAGDRNAFETLVQRYERPARAIGLAILHDHHLAADAAQEAFVAAYRAMGQLRDRASFGAWLMSIARHRAMRIARQRRRREGPLPPGLTAPPAEPPDDDQQQLLSAITALPEHERIVLMLRYFAHHDVAAIAGVLARPVGTVTKQLSRAIARLKATFAREEAS